MADYVDQWAAAGRKNIFGTTVKVMEMQSEAGAAGTVHGSLAAGALTTTYTASQGLLLMIPNMYKIAGELLPGVFHVSARTVATHALNIFGDHSDVYACRQTGFAMLAESNPQEVMDLGAVAHLAAIKGRVPFINFFDGFRTSHEIQKIEVWDYDDLAEMVDMDAVEAFRKRALNPEHPVMRGSHENGDIFFQHREACNKYYDALPGRGRGVHGQGQRQARHQLQAVQLLRRPRRRARHHRHGLDLRCGRGGHRLPDRRRARRSASSRSACTARSSPTRCSTPCPATAKKIAVLDRTKEPGALGEPLYLDVVTALAERRRVAARPLSAAATAWAPRTPRPPASSPCIDELTKDDAQERASPSASPTTSPTSSLEEKPAPNTAADGTIECKFWGLGGDGTVGANKNSIKIIGDHTDKYVQAYFQYDSKKTGGVTISPPALRRQADQAPPTTSTRPTSWPATTPPMSSRATRWSTT